MFIAISHWYVSRPLASAILEYWNLTGALRYPVVALCHMLQQFVDGIDVVVDHLEALDLVLDHGCVV